MPKRNEISLAHLDRMTDSTGLIQHAIYSIPRREQLHRRQRPRGCLCTRSCGAVIPASGCCARVTRSRFLEYARKPGGGFHNFQLSAFRFDAEETGDCQSQAIRALAEVLTAICPTTSACWPRVVVAVLRRWPTSRSLRARHIIWHCVTYGRPKRPAVEPRTRGLVRAARLVECFQRSRPDGNGSSRGDVRQRGAARLIRRRPALARQSPTGKSQSGV